MTTHVQGKPKPQKKPETTLSLQLRLILDPWYRDNIQQFTKTINKYNYKKQQTLQKGKNLISRVTTTNKNNKSQGIERKGKVWLIQRKKKISRNCP